MTEADIIATTFFHTCTIQRPPEPDASTIYEEELETVYEDIPCAVSSNGGSSETLNDEYQPVTYTDTLFTRPEIDIRAGDVITAKIYNDIEIFIAAAGRRYPSHRQTPIIRKERA